MAADEVIYIAAGAIGALGAILLFFLWNIACAPYRLERESHDKTKAKMADLEKKVPPPGRFLSNEQKQLLAATIRQSSVKLDEVTVVHFPSPECADFADSIGDALIIAGVKCNIHDGGFYIKNPKDRGIKLYVPKDEGKTRLASEIIAQMNKFGFACETRHPPDSSGIFFYIARSDGQGGDPDCA